MPQTRSSIFQSPEIRIVEASAGSGKTFALARRYVQLLLILSAKDPQAMSRILAVTFTNKAAFEMKARILEFLKKTAFGQLKDAEFDEIIRPLGLDSREASVHAAAAMEEILANYNFFQVQTIDKFINAILSAGAFRIGLTAQFRIRTRPEEYLRLSLDRLIDRAGRDPDAYHLFVRFLDQYLYLENSAGWFPKKELLAILKTLFDLHNTYGVDLGCEPFLAGEMVRRKSSLLKEMRRLREEIPDGANKKFLADLERFLDKHPKGFDLDNASAWFGKPEIPMNKGHAAPPRPEKLWKQIGGELRSLCEDEAMGVFTPYVEIFKTIEDDFEDICSRADIIFLPELNRKAAGLFQNNVMTLEEIYARLASRFRHYLMDEFQDTSRLQWANMRPMVEEALSAGGTLFYVGDRKQAIYSFRGGDSRLFDEASGELSAYPARKDMLTSNWRSHEKIVAFNNRIFSPDNLKRFLTARQEKKDAVVFDSEDTAYLMSVFEAAIQTPSAKKTGGYVEVSLIEGVGAEERDLETRDRLLPLMRDVLTRFSPSETAVLCRDNKEVESVTGWLMEDGLVVRSERTSDIRVHPLIRELTAFLAFLNSPIDNEAFAGFITGEMLAAASGVDRESRRSFVFDCHVRSRSETVSYLYMEFRKACPGDWEKFIEPFFKSVGLYPLYELTAGICHALGALKNFPQDQAFVMRFLELIKDQEDEYGDPASFLDYYQTLEGPELFVESSDQDAVTVTTVHKAKGLEFGAVILPSLEMKIQPGSRGEHQMSFVPWFQDNTLRLLRIRKGDGRFSPVMKNIYEAEYKKCLLSELNTVYVALTRACEEMYIMVPEKAGNSFNAARRLLFENDNTPEFFLGEKIQRQPKAPSSGPSVRLSPSPGRDWVAFLRDEFVRSDEWVREAERRRGDVLHQMLARVDRVLTLSKEEQDAFWQDMANDLAVDDCDGCAKIIKNVTSHPKTRVFFETRGDVFNEFEIVNRWGDMRRIDRLVITDQEAWIVDYKFSADHRPQDVKQVEDYKALIAEMHPKKGVKGFLIYAAGAVDVVEV